MSNGMTRIWLTRLSWLLIAGAFSLVAVSVLTLTVLLKFWAISAQLSSYVKIAANAMARCDSSKGDQRSMVAIAPDPESDTEALAPLHPLCLRILGYQPAKHTNSVQSKGEVISWVVYSRYDALFVDTYNRTKQGIAKDRAGGPNPGSVP